MQEYESIKKGINNKDIQGLRETIGSYCYLCRDFSDGEFDEMILYVEKNGLKIKDDKLIGELVSYNKNVFEEDDFTLAVFKLKNNFCDERIKDVKKIGRALYGHSNQKDIRKKEGYKLPNQKSHQKLKLLPVAIIILVVILLIMITVNIIKK